MLKLNNDLVEVYISITNLVKFSLCLKLIWSSGIYVTNTI
jgi:hypothetical protein